VLAKPPRATKLTAEPDGSVPTGQSARATQAATARVAKSSAVFMVARVRRLKEGWPNRKW
jgi:hypothetical protein